MKVVKTIELYNDLGEKLSVGDAVKVVTNGKLYEGKVKSINPMNIQLKLSGDSGVTILYKNIEQIV